MSRDCDRCLERLPELAGGSLFEPEARALQQHLGTCPACAAAWRDWQTLAAVLALPGPLPSLPPAERALAKAWESPWVPPTAGRSSSRWSLGLIGSLVALGLLTWRAGELGDRIAFQPEPAPRVTADRAGDTTDPGRAPARPGGLSPSASGPLAPVHVTAGRPHPSPARPWEAEPESVRPELPTLAAGRRRLAGASSAAAPGEAHGSTTASDPPAAGENLAPAPPEVGPPPDPTGGSEARQASAQPPASPSADPPTPIATEPPPMATPSEEPPPGYELVGEVVDETGRPIPGALLQFWVEPEGADQALVHLQDADGEGRFRAALPPGGYRLRGEAAGHESAWWGGPDRTLATVLLLPPAGAAAPLRLVLRRSPPTEQPSPPPLITAPPEPPPTAPPQPITSVAGGAWTEVAPPAGQSRKSR